MSATPFALFEIAPERLQSFAMYVLAIIGGALAGYLAAVILGRLFDRLVLGKGRRSADVLHTIFRILTSIAVAILVAILMFPGGGGGTGNGEGPGAGPDKPGGIPMPGEPDPKITPTKPPPTQVLKDKEKAVEVIKVDILGGSDVKQGGTDFYRVAGVDGQLTLEQLATLVADRRAALKPEVAIAIEYRFTRNTSELFQGTSHLRNWATEKKITIGPADTNGN